LVSSYRRGDLANLNVLLAASAAGLDDQRLGAGQRRAGGGEPLRGGLSRNTRPTMKASLKSL
jgi:hypothetical protein